MKNLPAFFLMVCLFVLSFHINFIYAQEHSVHAELSAGVEQDSNLNVVELDKNSHEGDTAAIVNAKVDGQWKANDQLTLSGSYAYSNKLYQHHDEFDLALHHLFADASYNAKLLTLGVNYNYADAKLAHKNFLELQQTSVYAAKLINERIYIRAASNFQSKNFDVFSNRNANNKSLAGDVFVFFNKGKTFIELGTISEDENAKTREFDYSGTTFKSAISNKFLVMEKENTVKLGWRYVTRDYTGITPTINAKRYDNGHVADVEWNLALTPHVEIVTKVEYNKYHSNLVTADYSATDASMSLKARF